MSDRRIQEIIARLLQVAGHRPLMKSGGLPENLFLSLPHDWQERLQCSICYQVLRSPHQCKNGHKFCRCCIQVWSEFGSTANYSTCPVCRVEGSYTASKLEWEEILRFRVKCPVKGCTWTGELKEHPRHRHVYQAPASSNHGGYSTKGVAIGPGVLPALNVREKVAGPCSTATGLPIPSRIGRDCITLPDIVIPPGTRPNPTYSRGNGGDNGRSRESPPIGRIRSQLQSRTRRHRQRAGGMNDYCFRDQLHDVLHCILVLLSILSQSLDTQTEEAAASLENSERSRREQLEKIRQLEISLGEIATRLSSINSP